MAVPPVVPVLAVGTLAYALFSDHRSKSRSEWERDFERWVSPASSTEREKVDATERAVRSVLAASNSLTQMGVRVISQGSAVNNTNTRNRSDVDLIAIAEADPWHEKAPGEDFPTGFVPSGKSIKTELREYRDTIQQTLSAASYCLRMDVSDGKKAIRLSPVSDVRVDCDVLPAFRYRRYLPASKRGLIGPDAIDGIAFITSDDDLIVSFPEQHLANGRSKNVRTNNRYKHVVRVLKKLRDRFESQATILTQTDLPSSYEIECLVYNVPDQLLKDGTIFDATLQAAKWLSEHLSNGFWCDRLVQVHGIYSMFGHWGGSLLSGFFAKPAEVEVCEQFINRVVSEIETAS